MEDRIMTNFKDKVIIITGGTRGIGQYLAEKLAESGANVVVCSSSAKASGGKILSIKADVSKYQDCQKLILKVIKKFKRLDVLINNAGVYGPIGLLKDNSIIEWEKTLKINLLGTVNCSKLAIPIMKKQKAGKIINFAGGGVGGKKIQPGFSSYFTSKFAIVGFTESLAKELEQFNIQVNAISPGNIYTNLTKQVLSKGKKIAGDMAYQNALKAKQGAGDSLEQVFNLIYFLQSADSNHLTGRILSAKWDSIEKLKKIKKLPENLFKLKRVDGELFHEG